MIKFIGNYDVLAEGKYLLEILCQLRDFGCGRLVTRGSWRRRWPIQPTYIAIRKVLPQMDRWLFKGTVYADWIYRGRQLGVYRFEKDVDRPDWQLIHRHDEDSFKYCERPLEELKFPAKVPLPPLLRYQREQKAKQRAERSESEVELLQLQVDTVPHVDEEFAMIEHCFKLDHSLNPAADGTIYDVDPQIYLDLYGEALPTKVEKWGDDR